MMIRQIMTGPRVLLEIPCKSEDPTNFRIRYSYKEVDARYKAV
jgi:hypothetical protein